MSARTQDEIFARIRTIEDEDLFGFRREVLISALDYEHARPFLSKATTAEQWAKAQIDDVETAARDYYERTLRIYPHFAPAHNNLANIHAYQGRMAEAIEHYERALELMPDYPRARENLNAARSMGKPGAAPPPPP